MPGSIFWDDPENPILLCRQSAPQWPFPINLVFKSDLIVTDPAKAEVLRIRRVGHLIPRFEMIENGRSVGSIRYHSPLRTSCSIRFGEGVAWEMRQPLFTIFFSGASNRSERVWIMVGPSKRQWNVLVSSDALNVYLLSALALMHREYWTH